MQVAFVLSHINKSLQWLWYSEELKKKGVRHFFILIGEERPLLLEDLEKLGVTVYFLNHRHRYDHLSNLWKAIRILIKERPDIVHTSLPFGNLIGQAAAYLAGIKGRVTTCENASWAHDFGHGRQKAIDRFTFRLSRKIIATCETGKEYLETQWKIPPGKLTTITQALKQEMYDSVMPSEADQLRLELGFSKDELIIGCIARLEHWKGHDYAIEAIRMLHPKIPKIRLLIVGSRGPEFEKLMAKISEYGLEDVIFYKGFIKNIPAFFKMVDIHVHIPISKYVETFGLGVIEGMASRCPQVLTRSGIAFSTAKHLENALVVDYCNAEATAAAIETLLNDPGLAERLAARAQMDAAELFKVEAKVDKSLHLYRSLLRQR